MLERAEHPVRWTIAHNYGRWTARSAMVGSASIKSSRDVNHAIDKIIHFESIFDKRNGAIDRSEFDGWHHKQVCALIQEFRKHRLVYGWAAKIIAIYLKTACYLGGFGRDGLDQAIHPPIDNILIGRLRDCFKTHKTIPDDLRMFRGIKYIEHREDYHAIISACQAASKELKCTLCEVDQLFRT